jgi:vacuolar-type H+-ATPase subunit H
MKKALKIVGILLLIIIIALVVIPQFYKEEINAFIKEDINKNLNAVVDYQDVSLSLFKDFPNLYIGIEELTIDGVDEFKDIRLASIKNFNISLDAIKVFLDKEYEIKEIAINQLYLNVLVHKNGNANYDIVKKNPNQTEETKSSSFELQLTKYAIKDADITYLDMSSGMLIDLQTVNHTGKAIITDKNYRLFTQTSIDKTTFDYDVKYLNEAKIDLKSEILIENEFSKYSLTNNDLTINGIAMDVTKSEVKLKGDDIIMDLAFQTQKDEFKQLLALIPKVYLESIEDLKTKGTASFGGFVKGVYNEKTYPAYEFDLKVQNAFLKYPDLPESLKDVNVNAKVAFKGGANLDYTIIDLPLIHFFIADNVVDGSLKVSNPMSDPLIQTAFKSKLDFNKLKKVLKIDAINQISGLLDADFSLNGRLSAIEKKQFNQFKASGFFNLTDFNLKSDSLPYPINISKAEMNITPEALKLEKFNANIDENDFNIKGNITNYIAYFLNKDQTLKADFNMKSKYINLNDFTSDEETSEAPKDTGAIIIPKNLDLTFTAEAESLIYKDLGFNDVEGVLKVKEGTANLQAVLLKTLDGQMLLNGTYDSTNEKPISSFDVAIEKMSIPKSATTFSTFQAFAPALQKVQGDFFSDMKMDVRLDENMNPILNTVKANGSFNTKSIQLVGIDLLKNIGKLLNTDFLDKPEVDNIKANFSIDKGTMKIMPFSFKLNNMKTAFEGTIDLEKQINFIFSLDIPREKLGANPNLLLEGLVGKLADLGLKTDLGEIIKMKFRIKGDYNNPKILPAVAGYEGNSTQEIITEVVKDKVEEVVTEVVDDTRERAQEQADKLMAKAQIQADSLISKAQQLSVRLVVEADKQGASLISKAGNPFEKIAAKVAANKLSKVAASKGDKLVSKAKEKANTLLKKAQAKADKLINTPVDIKKKKEKQ